VQFVQPRFKQPAQRRGPSAEGEHEHQTRVEGGLMFRCLQNGRATDELQHEVVDRAGLAECAEVERQQRRVGADRNQRHMLAAERQQTIPIAADSICLRDRLHGKAALPARKPVQQLQCAVAVTARGGFECADDLALIRQSRCRMQKADERHQLPR
jgi:hypothetical protein